MRLWDHLAGHAFQRLAWERMRGREPHALLLFGPPGTGKQLWARAAAQDLLCEAPPDGKEGPACGNCGGCRAAEDGSHPDLVLASPANGRFYRVGKSDTGDDEIRPLLDRIALKPARGRAKALILDRVEGLRRNETDHEAADALLKSLEEPPEGTRLFLVTSHAGDVLPTVISRCLRLFFPPLSREAFTRALGGRVPVKDLETLFRLSRGSPGEALRLAGLLERRQGLATLLDAPAAQAMDLASRELLPPKKKDVSLEQRRQSALERLELLGTLLRDRLPGLPPEGRLHADLPAPPSDPRMGRKMRALSEARDALIGNADLSLTLECCAAALSLPA